MQHKGITGSTLKIIAIISMLIDHIGAAILERMLIQRGLFESTTADASSAFVEANGALFITYEAFRIIGRMSFPIFCFLLVQGFLHTHDLKKYMSRLFLFALVSELPYDLAFSGNIFDMGRQNVFFTLFLGALAIAGIQLAQEKKEWNIIGRLLFSLLSVAACAMAASFLKTDYDMLGVAVIVVMYLFRQRKTLSVVLGCFILDSLPAFASVIPVHFYNGEKGKNMKWLFYLFYPLHILLLYLIACAMGLGQVMIGY